MARIRTIQKHPPYSRRNYFLVDACFLVDQFLHVEAVTEAMKPRIRECKKWWKEIDRQVKAERARVYVPDVCIAEAFKVLAKKYYQEHAFKNSAAYKSARDRLSLKLTTPVKVLKAQKRFIAYHDLPTNRDIIIAVDRFYELFLKHRKNVGVIDLIVVASAKYLMDFYDIPRAQLHVITFDRNLWSGSKKIVELPNAYDPMEPSDNFGKVFRAA